MKLLPSKRLVLLMLRILGIFVLILSVAYAGFWLYWWKYGNKRLEAARAELRALGAPMEASEIIPAPVRDEDNAAYVLNRTIESKSPLIVNFFLPNAPRLKMDFEIEEVKGLKDARALKTPRNPLLTVIEQVSDDDLKGYRKVVNQNKEVFLLIDEALKKPAYRQPIPYEKGPAILMPHLQVMRDYARHLSYRSIVECADGKYNEAARTLLLIDPLSRFCRSEPLHISFSVGVTMDNIAVKNVAPLLTSGKLNDETIQLIQKTFEHRNYRNDCRLAFSGERILFLDWFFDRAVRKESRTELSKLFFSTFDVEKTNPVLFKLITFCEFIPGDYFKREWAMVLHHQAETLRCLQDAPLNVAEIRKLDAVRFPKSAFIANMVAPALNSGIIKVGRAESIQKIVILACALEREKLSTKSYPPSLEKLAPKYLKEIPLDPFSGEKPIYRTDGKHYLLYYKGDDLTDDGGVFSQLQDIGLASEKSWLPEDNFEKQKKKSKIR
jgi:hypothetical protein